MTTMRPIRETIPLDDALAIVMEAASPIARTERVPLAEADGRVVGAAATATADVPPFDRAAMDGYAVIAGDTSGASVHKPKRLICVGRIFTGEAAGVTVTPGACVEVATGAPLPPGADAVVMVEDTERAGSDVLIRAAVQPQQHVGRRAADIAAGQTVLSPGGVLNPSRLGALAAIGIAEIDVYSRPRVAILSTGNEIVDPGRPLGPGQIYDINRFTLAAVVGLHGGEAIVHESVPDTMPALTRALDAALDADIVVFSGGSSVGERDLMQDLIRARGEMIFHGIAVKPGKPTAFGRVGGTPVFGMPGYPTSCLSNAYILLVPLLRRIARLPDYEPRTVRATLARRIVSAPGRHQFYTVRLDNGAAVPAFKASGDITSMSHADGYIEIPAHADAVDAGTPVDVKLF
jgi:molybdenum cofactor synthesis domain-containing protein